MQANCALLYRTPSIGLQSPLSSNVWFSFLDVAFLILLVLIWLQNTNIYPCVLHASLLLIFSTTQEGVSEGAQLCSITGLQ